MSLSRKIALNTLISASARIVSTVFALISVALITRTLGQEGFGEYTTIIAYLTLFVILSDLGLHSLMSREISTDKSNTGKASSYFFTLRLLFSFVFLTIGVVISLMFPYSTGVKVGMAIGAVGMFFLSISQLLLAVFQRYLAMGKAAIAEVMGRAAQLLLIYLIYINQDNFSSDFIRNIASENNLVLYLFVLAMSVASLVIFVLQFVFARKYEKITFAFDISELVKILKVAWPIALSITLTLVYFKIDTIFLSVMKPAKDVGIYGVGYRVLESLIFFPSIFAGIMLPILSRQANNISEFNKTLSRSVKAISIFAAPAVVGGIILSYSIVNLIGGKEFISAGSTMQILFVAIGLIFIGNIIGRAVIALNLQKRAVVIYMAGMVLNVVLNLIFIPKYTYIGAALTTVFTEFMIVALLFWLIKRKTNITVRFKEISKILIASGVMGILLVWFVSPISEPISFTKLIFAMVLAAGSYFGVLYLIKGVETKEVLSVLK